MPALTQSLLALRAAFLTARAARRLRDPRADLRAQDETRARLVGQLAGTIQGSQHGLERGMTYAQFQARAPLQTHETLAPFIARMKAGEADVLWPGRCSFFAASAGTTDGTAKHVPVTEAMLAHFRRAELDALLFYTARIGHTGVFRGRHLFVGGPTALTPLAEAQPHVAYVGDLSGILALDLPRWAEEHLAEPGADISRMADWPAKLAAIAARTRGRDITLLAGLPNWLLPLAEAVRGHGTGLKSRPVSLQAVWPNLECLVHGGVPVGPFAEELRAVCGPTVNFHEVYPAVEGFIAAQDAEAAQGLRLMTDAGLFFEFLPMRVFDEANLAWLGEKTVPLVGVQPGEDYALVLTTPAGLCRYVIGDVVRFVSTSPPRLIHVGRTRLQLNAFGERVSERELTDALVAVCSRHGWLMACFHVAPLFANAVTGSARGQHEWWLELKPISVETPTGPLLAAELDAELQRLSPDYAARRAAGGLEAPVVRLVMPGVFEAWLRSKGKWGGQHKMPRGRSDRAIAAELAQLAPFSK